MTRKQLIKKYETLMYKAGEYDVWQDDIEPKIDEMSTDEIFKAYIADKKWYEDERPALMQ